MKKYLLILLLALSIFIFCSCDNKVSKYNVVEKVEVTVDFDTYSATSDIQCEITGNKDREYIKLVFTVYQKNIFTNKTELYLNGNKVTDSFTISDDEHQIVYKFLNPNYVEDPSKVLSEVRFSLDTLNYKATSNNTDAYTVKLEVDKNYTYITTTLTTNDGYKFADRFDVYVNDELVKENFVINDERTELVYKIKDPNWTPTY